jgi:hypothetical protein
MNLAGSYRHAVNHNNQKRKTDQMNIKTETHHTLIDMNEENGIAAIRFLEGLAGDTPSTAEAKREWEGMSQGQRRHILSMYAALKVIKAHLTGDRTDDPEDNGAPDIGAVQSLALKHGIPIGNMPIIGGPQGTFRILDVKNGMAKLAMLVPNDVQWVPLDEIKVEKNEKFKGDMTKPAEPERAAADPVAKTDGGPDGN